MTPGDGRPDSEEPEIGQEEDIPSDGSDTAGEKMMKEVGNARLKTPPDAPAPGRSSDEAGGRTSGVGRAP